MQDKLQKDNAQLEIQHEKLRSSIDQMVQSEKLLQRDVRKHEFCNLYTIKSDTLHLALR